VIAGTTAKQRCDICGFRFYPGNFDKHLRSCIRKADENRRRELERQMKAAQGDPWAPYRVGGAT
jgi:hypothetical protein